MGIDDNLVNRYNTNPIDRYDVWNYVSELLALSNLYPNKRHYQYDKFGTWEFLFKSYLTLNQIMNNAGCSNVLDFGCGTGIGEHVWQGPSCIQSYDLDTTRLDLWEGSDNEFFSYIADHLNIDIKRFSPMIKDKPFRLIDQPSTKFDAVIAFRFPPLNHKWITPEEFKELIQPWCTPNFKLFYAHVSINYLRTNKLTSRAQLLSDLMDEHEELCVHNSRDLTVFEL